MDRSNITPPPPPPSRFESSLHYHSRLFAHGLAVLTLKKSFSLKAHTEFSWRRREVNNKKGSRMWDLLDNKRMDIRCIVNTGFSAMLSACWSDFSFCVDDNSRDGLTRKWKLILKLTTRKKSKQIKVIWNWNRSRFGFLVLAGWSKAQRYNDQVQTSQIAPILSLQLQSNWHRITSRFIIVECSFNPPPPFSTLPPCTTFTKVLQANTVSPILEVNDASRTSFCLGLIFVCFVIVVLARQRYRYSFNTFCRVYVYFSLPVP